MLTNNALNKKKQFFFYFPLPAFLFDANECFSTSVTTKKIKRSAYLRPKNGYINAEKKTGIEFLKLCFCKANSKKKKVQMIFQMQKNFAKVKVVKLNDFK